MKVSMIAAKQLKSVKELFLQTIYKSYLQLFHRGVVTMSVKELFMQQDLILHRVLFLSCKEAIEFLKNLRNDKKL